MSAWADLKTACEREAVALIEGDLAGFERARDNVQLLLQEITRTEEPPPRGLPLSALLGPLEAAYDVSSRRLVPVGDALMRHRRRSVDPAPALVDRRL